MPKSADENAGNAYGRGPQTHDAELTEIGPGTPCGEFMRRYWHPIALSEKVGAVPQNIRILGEDYRATVIPESPYDPDNLALRS